MKKPEKREIFGDWHCRDRNRQYNEACDEYEKFLPTEEEIVKICMKFVPDDDFLIITTRNATMLAKAIHKRIK